MSARDFSWETSRFDKAETFPKSSRDISALVDLSLDPPQIFFDKEIFRSKDPINTRWWWETMRNKNLRLAGRLYLEPTDRYVHDVFHSSQPFCVSHVVYTVSWIEPNQHKNKCLQVFADRGCVFSGYHHIDMVVGPGENNHVLMCYGFRSSPLHPDHSSEWLRINEIHYIRPGNAFPKCVRSYDFLCYQVAERPNGEVLLLSPFTASLTLTFYSNIRMFGSFFVRNDGQILYLSLEHFIVGRFRSFQELLNSPTVMTTVAYVEMPSYTYLKQWVKIDQGKSQPCDIILQGSDSGQDQITPHCNEAHTAQRGVCFCEPRPLGDFLSHIDSHIDEVDQTVHWWAGFINFVFGIWWHYVDWLYTTLFGTAVWIKFIIGLVVFSIVFYYTMNPYLSGVLSALFVFYLVVE